MKFYRFLIVTILFGLAAHSAWAEGFAKREELLQAVQQAVDQKDAKKFVSFYVPDTVNARGEELLTESIQPLFTGGFGHGSFAVPKGNDKVTERKIGFIDIKFKNDPNTMMSFSFGKFGGKFYLMMSQRMTERSKEPAAPPAAPASTAAAPVRSMELKNRIYLKNGKSFESAITDRNAKGFWAEIAPGARTYFSNAEVLKVEALDKAVTVTEKAPETPAAPIAKPSEKPSASVPAQKTDAKQFVRQVIEQLDKNGWDAKRSGYPACVEFMEPDYDKFADAGGIKEWRSFEEKKTNYFVADVIFNNAAQPPALPGQRAGMLSFTLQEKEGGFCVGSYGVSPYSAAVKPSWPDGKPEGEELLVEVKKAIQNHDKDKFMSLYMTDGVEKEMLDSVRPVAQSIVASTVESVTLEPPTVGDNKTYEHEGFRYRPCLPVLGVVKFVLKEYPDSSAGIPYGKKNGKYYLVTAIKEKI